MNNTQTMSLLEHSLENLNLPLDSLVIKYQELIGAKNQRAEEAKRKITVTHDAISVNVLGVIMTARPRRVISRTHDYPHLALEYAFAPEDGFGESPAPVVAIYLDSEDGIVISEKSVTRSDNWYGSIVIADHVIEETINSYVFKKTEI